MSYAIHCKPNFYAGDLHGNDRAHLLYDDGGETIALASAQQAQAICTMLEDTNGGAYELAHNQYAPPEYRVVNGNHAARRLRSAMESLFLQYDFSPDGSRLPLASHY